MWNEESLKEWLTRSDDKMQKRQQMLEKEIKKLEVDCANEKLNSKEKWECEQKIRAKKALLKKMKEMPLQNTKDNKKAWQRADQAYRVWKAANSSIESDFVDDILMMIIFNFEIYLKKWFYREKKAGEGKWSFLSSPGALIRQFGNWTIDGFIFLIKHPRFMLVISEYLVAQKRHMCRSFSINWLGLYKLEPVPETIRKAIQDLDDRIESLIDSRLPKDKPQEMLKRIRKSAKIKKEHDYGSTTFQYISKFTGELNPQEYNEAQTLPNWTQDNEDAYSELRKLIQEKNAEKEKAHPTKYKVETDRGELTDITENDLKPYDDLKHGTDKAKFKLGKVWKYSKGEKVQVNHPEGGWIDGKIIETDRPGSLPFRTAFKNLAQGAADTINMLVGPQGAASALNGALETISASFALFPGVGTIVGVFVGHVRGVAVKSLKTYLTGRLYSKGLMNILEIIDPTNCVRYVPIDDELPEALVGVDAWTDDFVCPRDWRELEGVHGAFCRVLSWFQPKMTGATRHHGLPTTSHSLTDQNVGKTTYRTQARKFMEQFPDHVKTKAAFNKRFTSYTDDQKLILWREIEKLRNE